MQFKHDIFPHAVAFAKLLDVLNALDSFSKAIGHGEIMITSLGRMKDTKSYHSKLQAADIRIHDKPPFWIWGIEEILTTFRKCDPTIQHDRHLELRGTPDEHIHIEIDTGDL